MRNLYKLSKLNKIECDLSNEEKEIIFFKMFDSLKDYYTRIFSIEELSNILNAGNYFIAHKYIIYKGKKRFYNGDMAISSSQSIIEFIKEDIVDNDLRPLLIAPVFEMSPEYVVYVHPDGVFFLYNS